MTERPSAPLRGRLTAGIAPYRRWWDAAATLERALGIVAGVVVAALAGAFLFGIWHVIGGGLIRGNWRAGVFGIGLAALTGGLLALGYVRLGARFRR